MDTNAYLAKQYDSPPCWGLVADVYANELASTVNDYKTVTSSVRAIASAFRIALHKSAHGFVQIAEPVDYCIVLMGRNDKLGMHHCGIYYGGKVLHALDSGNRLQEMSEITDEYKLIEFWSKPA